MISEQRVSWFDTSPVIETGAELLSSSVPIASVQSSCVSALTTESERLNSRLCCFCCARLGKQGCLKALAVAGESLISDESLRLLPAAGTTSDTKLEMLRLESDFAKPLLLNDAEFEEVHEAIQDDGWGPSQEAFELSPEGQNSAAVWCRKKTACAVRWEKQCQG